VNNEINQVIAEYIELMIPVIFGKGEKSDGAGKVMLPDSSRIPYEIRIPGYKKLIVKNERGVQGIRVDKKRGCAYCGYSEKTKERSAI
jgi:hypothetical protein